MTDLSIIKQKIPEILIENLSSDVVLQIYNVISSRNLIIKTENIIENEISTPINVNIPPKIIFIVPYRDREQQYKFFQNHMKKNILEDYAPNYYKIWYIHQCDSRDFNRGAMRNIGFLVAKEKYPNDYQNITFVFNDVDTMPYNKNVLHYETTRNIIKHFYGYTFALGGIVSMIGYDFERLNGYPNLWVWGFEDNCLQKRAQSMNDLVIDRSNFYPLLNNNILHFKDDVTRIVNRSEFEVYLHNKEEGINSITNLIYNIDENTGFVNIQHFSTSREQDLSKRAIYDLRNGPYPFKPSDYSKNKNRRNPKMGMFI